MNSENLRRILKDIETGTIGERKRAVDQLREFPFEQIKDHLFDGLRSNHHSVRSQCALILSEKGDETIIFPLLQAMSDESWAIRNSAKDALIRLPEEIVIPVLGAIAESSAGNTTLLRSIASVLAKCDHPDATTILVKLFDGSDDPELIESVTGAIGKKTDERSVNQLFHLLAHELWGVRKVAANAITKMPWSIVKEHLTKNLGNPNRFIHLATMEILISRADDDVLDVLTDTLNTSGTTAKVNALSVLSGIRTDESLMTMIPALGDSNPTIRNKAIEELGRSQSKAVVNLLKRCLKSSNEMLKAGAIHTFGVIGNDDSIDFLQELMDTESGSIKIHVLESLAHIGSRRAIQLIIQNAAVPDYAPEVARVLRQLDPDLAIQQLVNLLEEPDFFATAVKALIELDKMRVLRYLAAKLTSGSPNQQDKAVEAMGLLAAKESMPYLEKILEGGFSPQIVKTAETAMRRVKKSL